MTPRELTTKATRSARVDTQDRIRHTTTIMTCEKCWADAYQRAQHRRGPQVSHYHELLLERVDRPCSPREQAGSFWDDEQQVDQRLAAKESS